MVDIMYSYRTLLLQEIKRNACLVLHLQSSTQSPNNVYVQMTFKLQLKEILMAPR